MLILKILAGLGMLSVLVVVHEFGHYLFARLFKIGVPVFSIGMGPRVWGFKVGETDFRIAALPLGGYVQMSGADPFGEEDPDAWVPPEQDFMQKPVWQRLIVMFAGPGFNLALPLLLFTAILMRGDFTMDTEVGTVHAESLAAELGVEPGDRIVAVDGEPVTTWPDVGLALERHADAAHTLTLARGDATREVVLPPGSVEFTPEGVASLSRLGFAWYSVSSQVGIDDPASPAGRAGLQTGDGIVEVDGADVLTWRDMLAALDGDAHVVRFRRAEGDKVVEHSTVLVADPRYAPRDGDPHANRWGVVPVMLFVGAFSDDSAAEAAGIQRDDRLYALDGAPLRDWEDLLRRVKATAPPPEDLASGCMRAAPEMPEPHPVTVTLVREGELIDMVIEPVLTREIAGAQVRHRPLLGIAQYSDAFVPGDDVWRSYSLIEAVPLSVKQTVTTVRLTLDVLGQWLTRERKTGEALGGPIAIFDLAGRSAELGLNSFIDMVAKISIGLGLINLLPVPVLDGGQILFYTIEGVRGRPLSLALREKIQMVGVLFLVALILVVSVNDISRVISSGG